MMASAEKRALNEVEDNKSVAQLLTKSSEESNKENFKKNDEKPEKA
jgi:hypothetical protein